MAPADRVVTSDAPVVDSAMSSHGKSSFRRAPVKDEMSGQA
jgi:hypothetical protein